MAQQAKKEAAASHAASDSISEPAPSVRSLNTTMSNDDDDVPPPAYGDIYGHIDANQEGIGTRAQIANDGRVNIRIEQKTKGLSSLLVPALRSQWDLASTLKPSAPPPVHPSLTGEPSRPPPPLNLVIHVVGSRGDVQPFVALGKVLKEKYGHRVRLATHQVFKDFVSENGLEFFSIGGDPAELMAFMVKNPGLMPGFDTLRTGDIGRRRHEIAKMVKGCWRSCIEAGDGLGAEASDDTIEQVLSHDPSGDPAARPFVADAIIANPPSFAHIHCAEKLGIPLHMMFTMPWSPTQAFPHPLANIQSSNADSKMTNFVSYALVDMMTWQGLGDVINRFRQRDLGLEPISLTWAPGMLSRMRIPYTYCWSPALIPKPQDWEKYISISGFYFLNLATNFTPEPDLAAFLEAGPPPVYIGFGSIVVDDPNAMTKLIFEAVKKTGQRALVSKGWGGMGADELGIPDNVFMLGNVPHDWLFKKVSCVVHHGGAGTTAAGIACGRPTVVVPFFGDQPFWGAMVAKAGAGPEPVAYKDLTADILAQSITKALEPASIEKAKALSESISHETGTETGAQSFHQALDVDKLRCMLSPQRNAVWRVKRTDVRLSAFAATVLGNEGLLNYGDLKLYRPNEYDTEGDPWDPITGGASALIGTMGSMGMGIADMPVSALKALKIHPDSTRPRSRADSKAASPALSGRGSPAVGSAAPSTPEPTADSSASDAAPEPFPPVEPTMAGSKDSESSKIAAAQNIGSRLAVEEPQQSRNSSPSIRSRSGTRERTSSNVGKQGITRADLEASLGAGKGAWRIASAGIKSPMDFCYGLARGFHNAPKLYGDETVRKPEKVTGFSSGLRAAGKEFAYGMGDGISGLITQPMDAVKKEGPAGFLKGFGKGIAGVVFKPGAAFWGIPAYTSRGIYKELQKMFGPSVENYIIAARTAQGYEAFDQSTVEERAAIITHWKELKRFIRKKRVLSDDLKDYHDQFRGARERALSGVRSPQPEPGLQRTATVDTMDSGVYSPEESAVVRNPLSRSNTVEEKQKVAAPPQITTSDAELEEAIRRSVAETSTGDAEQDAAIERAIRASVAELEAKKSHGANEEELRRAMGERLESAEKHGFQDPILMDEKDGDDDDDDDNGEGEDDEELQKALQQSKELHEQHLAKDEEARREEEIVMQYMQRQSLLEEQMREKRAGAQG
ncbi:hypothetical protein FH972_021963 [Carpinus fangiana]|uniref:Uncharacterized protein n=1 Tax=Carpinus fangiana TaxID=176857 RepID=A0A5N6KRH6_9ROSI|nr:hypothetical protein FH972_021963 [Carpinus fangiana]KAB8339025.1 hypothetical protein FH972_021963 [Carpinus fangiana]KAB8339026.1 hypothetical protein FH972_021963 [Carpinus fangiana]KAB8339027.1 hypothetical protein FH972_021963 [Carpinus fangiana]